MPDPKRATPSIHRLLWGFIQAVFLLGGGLIPTGAAALPDIQVGPGELQVVGTIQKVDAANSSLLVDVTEVIQPGGKIIDLPAPRPKAVTIDAGTTMHVRNGRQMVELSDLRQGVQIVATGRDLGVGKELPARDVQVWDKMINGVYSLTGIGASTAELPGPGRIGIPLPPPPAELPERQFPVPGEQVWAVAYSPDGSYLAAGASAAGANRNVPRLQVWDGQTGKLLRTLPARGAVFSIAFSPDSQTLAAANGDGTVGLWDVDGGQLTRTLGKPGAAAAIAVVYSPDGSLVASSTRNRAVELWNSHTGALAKTLLGDVQITGGIAFSPDGKTLAACDADRTIALWKIHAGQTKTLINLPVPANKIAFSPDGTLLAVGSTNGSVTLWNTATAKVARSFPNIGARVTALAFSPDGAKVAAGSQDRRVRVWDAATGKLVHTIDAHNSPVETVAFSPDSDALASAGADGAVKVWKVG